METHDETERFVLGRTNLPIGKYEEVGARKDLRGFEYQHHPRREEA